MEFCILKNMSFNKKNINILFLGAGKRLSLMEQFLRAAEECDVMVNLYSAENSMNLPIALIADIFLSPVFGTDEFEQWLIDFVKFKNINIIIPNMDSAAVCLAELKDKFLLEGILPVVSSFDICKIMENKIDANEWFVSHNIPVPGNECYPKIMKPKYGFGAKDQFIIRNNEERIDFLKINDINNYIEQEFIDGIEYSVDVYVDKYGKLVSKMPRQRLRVVDGEVEESLSLNHPAIEKLIDQLFNINAGWFGPQTVQLIECQYDCKLIEVNTRFGGGVTHSIHCGLDMPKWIIKEFLGHDLPFFEDWKKGSIMTRCRRDIFL